MEEQRKKRQENIVAGVVGAFLGTLLGVVCTVVIGQLGYVASVSGLIMAVGALKGYELLGGRLSKKGAVISSVLILVMTWLAHRLTWAIALTSAAGLGVFESFQTIPELLEAGLLEGPAYWGDLVMLYLFTLLGAVPTIIAGLRSADLPDLPQGTAASAQGGELPALTLYPGSVAWMRPLRLSAAGAMFMGLIPGIALLLGGVANGASLPFTLAAMGCIAASFVMMFFAIPSIQLCYRSMNLMARSGSTVWRVTLPMLNNADTYRFTKRTGAFRAIRWEILNEQEREQLKVSVQRAVALLSSGQVMPGSALSAAVMPLPSLRIYKETRWAWKGVYSGRDGREKKVTIPKAYQGFAPDQELEPAQQPVPPRWGLLAAAAALTAVLALAGAALGLLADGGLSVPDARDPQPSPTATLPPEPSPTVQPDPQDLFHVGEELGYEFTAVGYIKAPEGMFGQGESYVDAHVPYSEEPVYLEDGYAIRSAAHGMEVSVKIVQTEGNAANVVNLAYELMVSSGTDIYEEGVQETYYLDEYDIAIKQVSYFEEDRTKVRVAVLYADYKQDGYYLSAAIVYQPELMDEDYPALLAELSDAYALNLPEIPSMDEA